MGLNILTEVIACVQTRCLFKTGHFIDRLAGSTALLATDRLLDSDPGTISYSSPATH